MARYNSLALFLAILSFLSSSILSAFASPFLPLPTQFRYLNDFAPASPRGEAGLASRTNGDSGEPQFPDQPPSCPICAQNFDSINSCAQAAPVLQNFTMVSAFFDFTLVWAGDEGTQSDDLLRSWTATRERVTFCCSQESGLFDAQWWTCRG